MRRNDEEFRAELMLRAKKYKEHRQKQCRKALKAASLAMMVCVLVVVSYGVQIGENAWHWPEETEDLNETTGEVETTDWAEEVTSAETVGEQSAEETEDIGQNTTSGTDELTSALKVIISTMGMHFDSGGASAEYENPRLAQALADYLSQLYESVEEGVVEEPETERPAGALKETVSGAENAQEEDVIQSGDEVPKGHHFSILYSDGTEISYIVVEGGEELRLDDEGRLILNSESLEQLKQIMRDYR